ncbi:MAG TPA: helix-turn-helix transcriptional regulator, partial [Tepidiformaceae bacterium]
MGRRRAANDPSIRTALSERQREVLDLMARGRTNAEIADRLGLSLEGAKWHVREIFGRLGVDSREEAVRLWRDQQSSSRRVLAWLPSSGGVALAGTAAVAVVAGAFLVFVTLGGADWTSGSPEDEPATTTAISTPPATVVSQWQLGATRLQQQPGLIEIEAGNQWRLL